MIPSAIVARAHVAIDAIILDALDPLFAALREYRHCVRRGDLRAADRARLAVDGALLALGIKARFDEREALRAELHDLRRRLVAECLARKAA